jgi:hypothetical protein
MDPGLSKRARDVRLIQDPQTLDPTLVNTQHTVITRRRTETRHHSRTRPHQADQTVRMKEEMV